MVRKIPFCSVIYIGSKKRRLLMKKQICLFLSAVSILACAGFTACNTDKQDSDKDSPEKDAVLQTDYEYMYTGMSFKKSANLTMDDLRAFIPASSTTATTPPKTIAEFEQFLLDNVNTYTITKQTEDGLNATVTTIPLKTPYKYILVDDCKEEEYGDYILYPYQGWFGYGFTVDENGFYLSAQTSDAFYVKNGGLHYDLSFNDKFSVVYNFEITDESHERAPLIRAYEDKLLSQGTDTQAWIDTYCGTYASGAKVALMDAFGLDYSAVEGTETVADYDFIYGYSARRIQVLYNGEFHSLSAAYAQGFLTEDDISKIFTIYYRDCWNNYGPMLQDGLKRRTILAAYEEKYPEHGKAKIEVFYDRYNSGAIAALISAENIDYPEVIWSETVGDYEFYYSNSNRISVLYEGEFYTLTDAYAQGYIDDFELAMLYTRHRNSHYPLYISKELNDFSFALTWNTYGISSYDSLTGELIKTKDAPNPEDFTATCYLSEKTMQEIYEYFRTVNFDAFPDVYEPCEGISAPCITLVLTVRYGEKVKTITANCVPYDFVGKDGAATTFLNTCKFLQDILEGTDEWQAFPDYPYLYD